MHPIQRLVACAALAAASVAAPAGFEHALASHASSCWGYLFSQGDGYGSTLEVDHDACGNSYRAETYNGGQNTEVDLSGPYGYVYATGTQVVQTVSMNITCPGQYDAYLTTTHSTGQVGHAHITWRGCTSRLSPLMAGVR